MATRKPSMDGANGRDASGKFTAGNKAGHGNPRAKRTAQFRTAILEAVTPEDVQAIIHALVTKAKEGDVIAAREVFDRTVGKVPVPTQPAGETLEARARAYAEALRQAQEATLGTR